MTSAVSNPTQAAGAATTATGGKNAAQELNDRFLKLLVAQMNNQDPLNPLDNAQVTSQMAQINTVTGINGLTDTVGRLLEQFGQMQSLQASMLTGRTVLADSDLLVQPTAGAAVQFGLDLPAAADKVTVEIRAADGRLVRTLQPGRLEAGVQRLSWDGMDEAGVAVGAGKYSITVKATAGTTELPAVPLMVSRVDAVEQGNGRTQLVLANGQRVAYSDVRQVI